MHISVGNQVIWARDPTDGYVSAKIGELYSDGAEIVPVDSKKSKRVLPFDDIFPATEQLYDLDDNCKFEEKLQPFWNINIVLQVNWCIWTRLRC